MTVLPPGESVPVDFITPRHLAGGGDPAWITVPLHRACGWRQESTPLRPRVRLSGPGNTARLWLDPLPDGPWWTLTHAAGKDRPGWWAGFGARTPVELIAAVTDALTDPAPADDAPSDAYAPLRQAGWTPYGQHGLVSPDETVSINSLGPREEAWGCFVTAELTCQTVWQAHFSRHTPERLLGAFTAALTDPDPVARTDDLHSLPHTPGVITRETTTILAADVAAALEDRVRSLATRHTPHPSRPQPQVPLRKRRIR
ncbi:DUF317 domain-containing protein [Streptomyces acidiscabies]|uniref:DUF317 domain-containing protein n=1 Tax=Streptomyces acidiscabies TaxID=42234 RepID=A0AAP6BJ23_9ACTN|nr:DUF317 domain-containing protein [Streptomyces acidiscabies]MBP5935447.1 DUF317 domain-containing protein [Streptomyces sp. LBUM 1476]MBZ3916695.1 DUF317 domain-containing protein [Streptomyces acidiscabies]MDX2965668.1 DUF317 domain-containing protein [Streptomyces acidiscabies]MDX3024830.1 DUF317 domain-containing protein [Streptomyces acidiscabies]MDX3795584.1 DUF317 domain-containing protein [Streptomyces acidiscabies]